MPQKRRSPFKVASACLAPRDSINHIDHLAVIAYIMEIPIVVDEAHLLQVMKKYYPKVKPLYISNRAQILAFLADEYDALFVSSANYRKNLSPSLELLFRKKMQFWYCPHGNSDKSMRQFSQQNLSLIYGQQMEDRLRDQKILPDLDACIRTGNYRLLFYRKNRKFYEDLAEMEVFAKFGKKQTTILYAPTWQDLENSSSFFEIASPLIEQLPDHYNLVVKLHPWLEYHRPEQVYAMQERHRDRPNALILSASPLVFPILQKTDIYIGDFSSIGYDFLYFNRPMFFFEVKERNDKWRKASKLLHAYGTTIPHWAYGDIYAFVEKNLSLQERFKESRAELYRYAFGEERNFDDIRNEIRGEMEKGLSR